MAALLPVIEQLDAQPLQVSIEVLIAEVILTNYEEFGIEVGLQSPRRCSAAGHSGDMTSFVERDRRDAVPPGTDGQQHHPAVHGQAFPFNRRPPAYSNSSHQGIVGLQGLTNYGVGRASPNGVGGFVFSAGSDTVNVLIRALKTQGRVDT